MLLLRQHTRRRACRAHRDHPDTLTWVPAFTLGRDDVRADGSVYQQALRIHGARDVQVTAGLPSSRAVLLRETVRGSANGVAERLAADSDHQRGTGAPSTGAAAAAAARRVETVGVGNVEFLVGTARSGRA